MAVLELSAAGPLPAFNWSWIWVHDGQEPAHLLFLGSKQEDRRPAVIFPQELLPFGYSFSICSQVGYSGEHRAVCLLLSVHLGSQACFNLTILCGS